MKCDNVERKCDWEGTVKKLKEHLDLCQLALLPCPRACKDKDAETKFIIRKDLDEHLEKDCPKRSYKCQYCGEMGTYASITQIHDQTCDKKIFSCPNSDCSKIMERREVNKHVDTVCEHSIITCKYKKIGCEVKKKRRSMRAHERDDKNHLRMAIDMTLKLESVNFKLKHDLQAAIDVLEERQLTLKDGKMTLKLTEYQKWKRGKEMFSFLPFYSHSRGYHMTLSVYVNGRGNGEGSHVSVFAPIVKGRYDAELNWPFSGTVTFTLLNQLEDKNHHSKTISVTSAHNARVGSSWGHQNTFILHSELSHEIFNNVQYLKDDTLYFRVVVEVDEHKPWLECIAQ